MYKCEICGKEYENIEERVACETKCLHDRKVAEEKRKKIKLEQEKETRKQEIQMAANHYNDLLTAFMKDYGTYPTMRNEMNAQRALCDILDGLYRW